MITFSEIGRYGRLGNQMFQVALLIAISEETGIPFAIPHENTTPIFGRYNPVIGSSDIMRLELLDAFEGVFPNIDKQQIGFYKRYNEKSFEYDEEVFSVSDNTDFHGYFQTEKYFKNARNKILELFTFKPLMREYCQYLIEDYKRRYASILVSTHVSRGDSLPDNGDYQTFGTTDYYRRAIDILNIPNAHYLVFSDDKDWCYENFKGTRFSIIDNRYSEKDGGFLDMCLMSLCSHNIIVSSTFGWWGAWLNKNPDKIVITPNKWWGEKNSHLSERDIRPEEWITICP
jgi:hypothetical protein